MTLQDVIDQLSGSELSNLFVFDDDMVSIDRESRKKLIPQVNLGLQLLHNRFFLREGTEVVNMQEGVDRYTLTGTDVLRIEKVADLDGNEYLLDIEDEDDTLRRVNHNTLVVPPTMDPTTLVVTYRAGPSNPILKSDYTMEPTIVKLGLPPMYLEPLVFFVASRFLNPMGASEGFHEGNNYAAKYEQACRLLEMQNFDLDRHDNHDRLHSSGWV